MSAADNTRSPLFKPGRLTDDEYRALTPEQLEWRLTAESVRDGQLAWIAVGFASIACGVIALVSLVFIF